jgi:hypothetical protein
MGKVSDYEVVFGNGIFNCCFDDIQDRDEEAYLGMKIHCNHCEQTMILKKIGNNYKWVAFNE